MPDRVSMFIFITIKMSQNSLYNSTFKLPRYSSENTSSNVNVCWYLYIGRRNQRVI